ncbi:hypothetical protein LTR37_017280 [Vermiconidia calcicola]|uniref:Uncharacterized protein n=1 Tax=Vermiconidia calcicola TaxID=1690605 RepID=A0ACC3MLG0_9PEZI|nr:hypothetical protein LTR37_017280 [Vermiconidia calcicola]
MDIVVALASLQHAFTAEHLGNWQDVKTYYDLAFKAVKALAPDQGVSTRPEFKSTVGWLSRVSMLAALHCIPIVPENRRWLFDYLKERLGNPGRAYTLICWKLSFLSLAIVIYQHRTRTIGYVDPTMARRLFNVISRLQEYVESETCHDESAGERQAATLERNWMVRASISIDLAALDLALSHESGLLPAQDPNGNLQSLAHAVCMRHQDWMVRYRGRAAPAQQSSFVVASLILPGEERFMLWRDQVLHMLRCQGYFISLEMWLRLQKAWKIKSCTVCLNDSCSAVGSATSGESCRVVEDTESQSRSPWAEPAHPETEIS